MSNDETRRQLQQDIALYRQKAAYYESLRLSEAADYAKRLANNIELALTTMPSDGDTPID